MERMTNDTFKSDISAYLCVTLPSVCICKHINIFSSHSHGKMNQEKQPQRKPVTTPTILFSALKVVLDSLAGHVKAFLVPLWDAGLAVTTPRENGSPCFQSRCTCNREQKVFTDSKNVKGTDDFRCYSFSGFHHRVWLFMKNSVFSKALG